MLYFKSDIQEECKLLQECPPTWWTGEWQTCYNETRSRSVLCVFTKHYVNSTAFETVLPDNLCNENYRPESSDRNCSPNFQIRNGSKETNLTDFTG